MWVGETANLSDFVTDESEFMPVFASSCYMPGVGLKHQRHRPLKEQFFKQANIYLSLSIPAS